jgi:hypothetical protein
MFGLPGTSNNFTMNGGEENDPYLNLNNSGASNLLLGTNDVSEATVVTNAYSGQYGHLAGAQINYVSKSGTNAFHGNADYLWNGRVMNANDWFANNTGSPRPFVNSNQYFASIGGPIVKDKTFFFVDYEGYRVVLPTSNITFVPTQAYENYVLGNLPTQGHAASVPFYQNIFKLYNGAPGSAGAPAVTANDDPALGCGDLAGTAAPGGGVFGTNVACANKFNSEVGNFTPEYTFHARVDQHFGDHDTAFIHFRTDHGTQPTSTDPINPIFNATSIQPDWEGQLSETHVFGSNAVNQAVLTGSWYSAIFNTTNRSGALAAFPTTLIFAGDGIFANLGGADFDFPQGRNVTQTGLLDDFSWTHGNHTFKFGGSYAHDYVTDAIFGVLTSGEAEVFSMTDFSNGGMDLYAQRYPTRNEQRVRLWNLGLYAQDDWRVTNNLKLTLTLRGDHDSNPTCDASCFANLTGSFQSIPHGSTVPYNSVIANGLSSAFPSVQTILWQPRFGASYSPWHNTVFSGGFGLFYDAPPATVLDSFMRNSPQVNSFTDQNGAIGLPADPFSPAENNNVFSIVNASNAAFVNAYSKGGTLTTIKAAAPLFVAPAYTVIPGQFRIAQYKEWNFKIQQALNSNTSLTLNYVGNAGNDIRETNAGVNSFCSAATCTGGLAGVFPTTSPDPMFKTVSQLQFDGFSNYNGVTTSLQHRFSYDFSATFSYAYSHALDTISNGGYEPYGGSSLLTFTNPNCLRCNDYGNADYDLRHYISMNYVWTVPFNKLVGDHAKTVFGGWTVSGDLFWHTGFPYSVTTSLGSSITNYGGTIYGQQIAPITGSCSDPNHPCLTTSEFAPASKPITSFGNEDRNQYRGPGFFDTDMSVKKSFNIPKWETGKLSLGANFYNLFNHPNFANPTFNLSSGLFGTIQSTVSVPTSIFGSFVGAAASPRLIQLQAKFDF